MTAKPKPQFTCDECRVISPGWHWIEPVDPLEQPRSVRCPQYLSAMLHEQAQQMTAEASEQSKKAARRILADAAHTLPEFSANDIREAMEAAQVPPSAIGRAFTWAHEQGLIEPSGRRVMSTEASTRHKIDVWASLVYGKRGAVA